MKHHTLNIYKKGVSKFSTLQQHGKSTMLPNPLHRNEDWSFLYFVRASDLQRCCYTIPLEIKWVLLFSVRTFDLPDAALLHQTSEMKRDQNSRYAKCCFTLPLEKKWVIFIFIVRCRFTPPSPPARSPPPRFQSGFEMWQSDTLSSRRPEKVSLAI